MEHAPLFRPGDDRLDLDLLVVPDVTLILVSAIIEPLRAANRVTGRKLFGWRLVSPDGQAVTTPSGIPLPVDGRFEPQLGAAPLVVAASYNWRGSDTPSLRRRLSQAARHRAAMVGVESGSWLMAGAGLLDGQRATTHWEDHEAFAAAFPEVELCRERYVIHGKRVTTGGALPTVDLMLEIIRRRHGYPLALEVAKLFIYEPASADEQASQVPTVSNLRRLDRRVGAAVSLMEETLATPLPLPRLARRVGVGARHLQALFVNCLGVAPHQHYRALRLNAARRQVIETRLPFADIASATGFNSAAHFARSYRDEFGESASQTRKRL